MNKVITELSKIPNSNLQGNPEVQAPLQHNWGKEHETKQCAIDMYEKEDGCPGSTGQAQHSLEQETTRVTHRGHPWSQGRRPSISRRNYSSEGRNFTKVYCFNR